MMINWPGGVRSDGPPVTAAPFVLYGENIRWRLDEPETLGLHAQMLEESEGDQIVVPVTDLVTVHQDPDYLMFGVGKLVIVYDWDTGVRTEIPTPAAADEGRWWFDSTREGVICARGALDGGVYRIERNTLDTQVLANSPAGAKAGGIISGIVFLGGAQSAGTTPAELVARWSARRTDPATGGQVGWTDWTTRDINASGELPVPRGAEIIGGGPTSLGFVLWTESSMHMFEPRTDLYVFSERTPISRGLLAPDAWCESDGRIWWFDNARVLNMFDGGAPRQIPNPMRTASIEALDETQLELCSMTQHAQHSEVILLYPTLLGGMAQLVYNYADNVWYPWRLDRIALTDRAGPHPAVGVDSEGKVWAHELPRITDPSFLRGAAAPPAPGPLISAGPQAAPEPEPFDWMISTSIITSGDAVRQGLRGLNVVLNHTYAFAPRQTQPSPADRIEIQLDSYDTPARDAPLVTSDVNDFEVGAHGADLRGGGKGLRVTLRGEGFTTFVKLGELTLDAGAGARK